MIEVRQLCKHFGSHKAVDNVTFDVKAGEIVGFLGPNGAGKTTTIRVLTCYHPATSGTVSVAGYDVFKQSRQVRSLIGYMPEAAPLYPEMRVREYLRFRGKLRGLDRAAREKAIGRVVERCWLGDVVGRPIGQLSKGYRQRVGLADTLLHDPQVLLLDEPTVGLDPTQIRETRSLIRELAEQRTVIMSSHILPEVEATCQRIIIINRGRIVAAGSVDELRERVADQSRLIAEIKGPKYEVLAAIGALPGVRDVTGVDEHGWVHASVGVEGDQREALAHLARDKRWPLRELRREIASLEDFFVKIVAEARQVGV